MALIIAKGTGSEDPGSSEQIILLSLVKADERDFVFIHTTDIKCTLNI